MTDIYTQMYCPRCRQPLAPGASMCDQCQDSSIQRTYVDDSNAPHTFTANDYLLLAGWLLFILSNFWGLPEELYFVITSGFTIGMLVLLWPILELVATVIVGYLVFRDVWTDDLLYGWPAYICLGVLFVLNVLLSVPGMFISGSPAHFVTIWQAIMLSSWSSAHFETIVQAIADLILLAGLWRRYGPPQSVV